MQANILLIDDDAGLCDLIANDLEARGHKTRRAHSAEDGLRLLGEDNFDVVVTDVNMGAMSGVDLCRHVRARHEDLPVVVMTAYGTLESAIAAIRAGAYDFVTKPFEFDHFALVIDRALGLHALRREVARLRSATNEASAAIAPDLLGRSPALERVRDLIARVADTDSTILITGESGTGKELVAKAIHDASSRKGGQFVAINCAAMPETLLESELFGHARGAFTDAKAPRTGLFVRANQGTVFLDEIGEMPAGMQAKLLRALQERRVRPVGSDTEVEFDARIITATHRDLETEVNEKKFREDLFYRINVVRIHVPPLRARGNDTLMLAQRFLEKLSATSKRDVKGMSAPVAQKLLAYPWPGNVRQLQNCVERAVAVSRGKEIALEDLPDDVRDYQPSKVDLVGVDTNEAITAMPTMDEIERRYIRQVLGAVAGNKTLAAQILGFDRRTLYRKLDRMNEPNAVRHAPTSTASPSSELAKSIPPSTAV
ncbi:MAG TPA: sigma-54 dependent transcriptional regulator [Polyangiaceae bacterium]|jgi:two-component system response regulator HydG|nr:sigma-54 dependent transcriptional regulator [Polyangiaceae bacterium]